MKRIAYLEFIRELLGDEEAFQAFQSRYQQRLPKSIKMITSKSKKSDLLSFFAQQWWNIEAPNLSNQEKKYDGVCYIQKQDAKSLWSHFLHQWGFFYVQEVSAGLSAQVLPLEKWDKVLDLCAAPWGKTIQLADQILALWWGFVLANEVSNARRKALIFNLNRCGLFNTAISAYDGTQIGDLAPESFDKVLVDAPCSGEWMQYKHDKTVQYRDQKSADQLAKLQVQLLISGLKALKIWWTLVYSTCTLNPFENEGVVSEVLKKFWGALELEKVPIDQKSKGFTCFRDQQFFLPSDAEKVARFWPHVQHTGGFFIAKIKKVSSLVATPSLDKRTLKSQHRETSSQLQDQVRNYLTTYRWIPKQSALFFLASQQAIYVTNDQYAQLPKGVFIEKIWIPLFKIGYSGERIPQQGLATVLGDFVQQHCREITDDQAQELTDTGSIRGIFGEKGEFLILQWEKKGFALVKQGSNELKSKR